MRGLRGASFVRSFPITFVFIFYASGKERHGNPRKIFQGRDKRTPSPRSTSDGRRRSACALILGTRRPVSLRVIWQAERLPYNCGGENSRPCASPLCWSFTRSIAAHSAAAGRKALSRILLGRSRY